MLDRVPERPPAVSGSATGERPALSVVIIARNEARRIGSCLDSVRFADERIVADTGSEDDTALVAEAHGARVISIPFTGFGPTKQQAIEKARGDWVLSLDADEQVSAALGDEILEAIRAGGASDGYILRRRAWFLGRRINHGGWGSDQVLRLFRRGRGRFSEDLVHERIAVAGPVGRLRHHLEHHSEATFAGYLAKIERYSTLAAEAIAADPEERAGVGPGLAHATARLIKMCVFRGGWRDGLHGALLAVSSAYSVFLRYVKADLIRKGRGDAVTVWELRAAERRASGSTGKDPDGTAPGPT